MKLNKKTDLYCSKTAGHVWHVFKESQHQFKFHPLMHSERFKHLLGIHQKIAIAIVLKQHIFCRK